MSDNDDIDALRGAFASREGQPGPDCPTPEQLFDAASGAAPAPERLRVVDHLTACASCAQDWQLAVAMAAGEDAQEHGVRERRAEVVPLQPKRRRDTRWAMLAAAAAVVMTIGVLLQQQQFAPDAGYREATGPNVARTTMDGVTLQRDDVLLRWQSTAENARWRVRVLRADLEPLFVSAELDTPQVRVPDEALERVVAGERLLWQVETRLPDGQVLQSPVWHITVR